MKYLHLKVSSASIESVFGRVMEPDLPNDPSDLVLVGGLTWLRAPESLIALITRIILQSYCVNLIDNVIKNNFSLSIRRDKRE